MKRSILSMLFVILLFLSAGSLRADDTDLLATQVEPDVLIALDLSGSMGSVPAGDILYSSDCNNGPYYGTPGPGRSACTEPGQYGVYSGPTCEEPYYKNNTSPHNIDCSKLAIAKRAIFDILDDTDNGIINNADEDSLKIRMGYMRFKSCEAEDSPSDYTGGCNTLRKEIALDYRGLNNLVSAETNEFWTPLASQLDEAGKYLTAHQLGDPAKDCRKKFVVMVTDGWDTLACGGRRGVDENTTRSFAYKRRRATIAKAAAVAQAGHRVYVIGFGADMPLTERNTLNWAAKYGNTNNPLDDDSVPSRVPTILADPCTEESACNADPVNCTVASEDPGYADLNGYAFLAQDSAKLTQALKTVLKGVIEQSYSFTAPSIPSVRMVDNNVVYISSLIPNGTPFWKGNLKAYQLDDHGMLPVNEFGYPTIPAQWDAVEKLKEKSPDARKIYTAAGGTVKPFTKGDITIEDLGVLTVGDRDKLIDHVRGYDPYDINQNGITAEAREWMLGDIFHSNAVIVGEPNRFHEEECYDLCRKNLGMPGFYETHKNRTKMIFVGSNDGMLHLFNAATGEELGAFIPPTVLKNLRSIKSSWDTYIATGSSGSVLYLVDGSPKASDVWFYSDPTDTTKTTEEWRTVLVSGLRKGGKTYFALDITEPSTAHSRFLWEFPTEQALLDKMGQSWSDPAIGKVKVEVGDGLYERWVAFIGGGYDPNDEKGLGLFVVDLKTGQLIKEFSGLEGMTKCFAAPPKAVDTNGDGYVDKVYIGDVGGQMWVFDVSFNKVENKSNTLWSGKILFKSPSVSPERHPIYYQPAVAFDPQSNLWVFFGTGNRERPMEIGTERIYAVKDDGLGDNGLGRYPLKEDDLKNVTGNNTFQRPPDSYKGWYIRLEGKEKVLAKPTIFHHLLYLTTYTPKEDPEPCTVGGQARLYILQYLSGGGAHDVDELADLMGSAGTRWKVIGAGAPSDPVITVNQQGQSSVIAGNTSGGAFTMETFDDTINKRILYWQEVVGK